MSNDDGAERFYGTASWTHTYPRVSFSVNRQGSVALRPNRAATGTAVERWDHGSDFCTRESGTARGRSTLNFGGQNQVFGRRPFTWTFNLSSVHGRPDSGDTPACFARHELVQVGVGSRRRTVSFGASSTNLMFNGNKVKGKPGFPLDRLLAGKGFSYSTRGTTRNAPWTGGSPYVTDGSMRIVFTPVR